MAKKVTKRINEIQRGDNTHHQDQLMYPVNFKTIKTIVSKPEKPMPLLELLDDDLLLIILQ